VFTLLLALLDDLNRFFLDDLGDCDQLVLEEGCRQHFARLCVVLVERIHKHNVIFTQNAEHVSVVVRLGRESVLLDVEVIQQVCRVQKHKNLRSPRKAHSSEGRNNTTSLLSEFHWDCIQDRVMRILLTLSSNDTDLSEGSVKE